MSKNREAFSDREPIDESLKKAALDLWKASVLSMFDKEGRKKLARDTSLLDAVPVGEEIKLTGPDTVNPPTLLFDADDGLKVTIKWLSNPNANGLMESVVAVDSENVSAIYVLADGQQHSARDWELHEALSQVRRQTDITIEELDAYNPHGEPAQDYAFDPPELGESMDGYLARGAGRIDLLRYLE